MSSAAAKDHARLVAFLDEAQRLDKGPDDDDTAISHQLLRPGLSTLTYEAKAFEPKRFIDGLPKGYVPYRVWLHASSNTLFFVTRNEPYIKWTRSKAVRDLEWAIFVLHYDQANGLLYLSTSDKSSTFEGLAQAVGATKLIHGDTIFRCLGRISRLQFQNVGVKKHGRRNLSYAMYTGADVAAALGLTEKGSSVKANLSGMGWEGGRQILIGCSLKGRVWSRDYPDHRHQPIAALSPDIARRTVTLMSAGKTFNISGLKLAFAVIPNVELRERIAGIRLGLVPLTDSLMGAVGTEAAFRHGDRLQSRHWRNERGKRVVGC